MGGVEPLTFGFGGEVMSFVPKLINAHRIRRDLFQFYSYPLELGIRSAHVVPIMVCKHFGTSVETLIFQAISRYMHP